MVLELNADPFASRDPWKSQLDMVKNKTLFYSYSNPLLPLFSPENNDPLL